MAYWCVLPEPMFTITPYFWARMTGTTAWLTFMVPMTLSLNCFSQTAGSCSSMGTEVLVEDGAGHVAEDVDAAELVHHLVDHGLDGGVVGDVRLEGDAAAARVPDRLGGLLGALEVDVGDRHGVDALGGQKQGDLLAEAHLAAGAGDERHLSLKGEIHRFLPFSPRNDFPCLCI